MKILHYSEPGSGGVKRHVVDLLFGLPTGDWEFILIYSLVRVDASYPTELIALTTRNTEVYELSTAGHLAPLRDMRSALKLAYMLWRKRPDVLHLHSSKAGALGRMVCRVFFPEIFVIYVPHAMAAFRSKFYGIIERFLAPAHDLLVAVSRSEHKDFFHWEIERSARRATWIPMGVSAENPFPQHVRSERFTVISCGRICYQKNALLFFEAAIQAGRAHPEWQFRWIGAYGDDFEALQVREMLRAAGNPRNIEITGWKNDPLPLMAEADVFCMFSRYESFGYVTAEAMQLGLAVLATDATGTRDLILPDETGLVAEPSVDVLVSAWERLAKDPVLRSRLGAKAKEFIAARHSIEGMCTSVNKIYEAIERSRRFPVI